MGGVVRGAKDIGTTVAKGANAVAHPGQTAQKAAQSVSSSVRDAVSGVSKGFREGFDKAANSSEPDDKKTS
jgi:hypothetical protein